jgi:preprotein translocase subunit SecB
MHARRAPGIIRRFVFAIVRDRGNQEVAIVGRTFQCFSLVFIFGAIEMAENTPTTNGGEAGAQLQLQKVYIKDASFEVPSAPHIFQEQGQPQVQLNLEHKVGTLGQDVYEVVLTVTVTCKLEEKTAYLAEVQQAGVFGILGFDDASRDAVLATYCPNVLFPYARQIISDLIQNGGFPPFLLQPINFDALYAEQQRRAAEGQGLSGNA